MLLRTLILSTALLSGCDDSLSPDQGFRQANKGFISAAFSRDGTIEFISSFQHGGSLWRTKDKERLYDWNHTDDGYSAIRAAVFSEDDKFVLTTEGKTVVLWDASSGESIRYWHSPSRILAVDIAKQYVLLGQEDNIAILVNIIKGGVVGSLKHDGPVSSVSINDDANFALTGSHDGAARYWSLDSGMELQRMQYDQPVDFVLLSNDGKLALSASYQGKVSIWNTAEGSEVIILYRKNPGVVSARFNSDSTELLLGTSREKVILWDLEKAQPIRNWLVPNDGPWHKAAILSVSFDKDQESYLAAASNGLTYQFN